MKFDKGNRVIINPRMALLPERLQSCLGKRGEVIKRYTGIEPPRVRVRFPNNVTGIFWDFELELACNSEMENFYESVYQTRKK